MFYHGYDHYMAHAFPLDELDPIGCAGRGPDVLKPENININDVLGNYSLTLIDSMDTLALLGDKEKFRSAVDFVVESVDFDQPYSVQGCNFFLRFLQIESKLRLRKLAIAINCFSAQFLANCDLRPICDFAQIAKCDKSQIANC
jgi:hypothetical protein